jgi:hypothetical protein
MIYHLNNETHWELSPDLMRELVGIVNHRILNRPPGMSDRMLIELSNCRSALACELDRLADKKPIDLAAALKRSMEIEAERKTTPPADNSDLI